jgi:invasion protein IalB
MPRLKPWTLACATLAAAMAAQAQAPAEPPAAPGGEGTLWLVTCSNRVDAGVLNCEFSQSIVLTRDGQRVATASFVRDAGASGLAGVFTVPVGVHLPAGIEMSVDGASLIEAPFLTCDARGCIAEAEIGAGALETLVAGETMTLTVARADRQPLRLDFDLAGFAEAEALLP